MRRLFIILCAASFLNTAADISRAQTHAKISVRVMAEATAQNERLTLGDIAEVRGDENSVKLLRRVELGYAPNVGAVRELAREKILLSIIAAGFASDQIEFLSPSTVIIRRAAQLIDESLLREAIEKTTLAELNANGATAHLVRLDLPSKVEVAAGKASVRASIGAVQDYFAPFIVSVEIAVDNRVVQRFPATVQVEAFAPVLVAARDIAAGTRLRADAVKAEVRRITRPPSFYFHDAASLRGFAARCALASGEAITRDALAAEIIVKPGEAVKIIGESEKLNITVAGEARAAGRVGDRIQVKNLQSGALLQAVVVDEGLVKVHF
jgi:flagella basal body P-ring formation protein FlgA